MQAEPVSVTTDACIAETADLRCSFGCLGRWFAGALYPLVGRGFGTLQCIERFESWRHRSVLACENLVMLNIHGPQPALLSHCDSDEITDLDQFRFAEMLVQARPEDIVGR